MAAMGFLKRLRGRTVPWWVDGYMDAEQYQAFDAVVHADLGSRGWTYRQEDDGIVVEGPAGSEPTTYGLTNIAQLCAGIDRSEWPVAIKRHFDNVSAMGDASSETPAGRSCARSSSCASSRRTWLGRTRWSRIP